MSITTMAARLSQQSPALWWLLRRPCRKLHTVAAVCEHLGMPLVYRQWDLGPTPPGHVKIRVAATGVNYAEILQVKGKYQEKQEPPFVPGNECAGEVCEVGANCEDSGMQVGDRVICLSRGGAYASHTVARWQSCVPLGRCPAVAAADLDEAAALMVAYGTAHLALVRRANVQKGQTLLVTAAAGGVGLACVQLARQMGLRVIAACGSEEKLRIAQEHGAEPAGINYGPSSQDFRTQLKEAAGKRGVDVVVDMVGGHAEQAVRSLNWEGRVVVVGFSGGRIPQIPANLLLVKNVSVSGVFFGGYLQRAPDVLQQSARCLVEMWLAGEIKPVICNRVPLSKANEAFELIEGRKSVGKVLLRPDS